MVDNPSLLVIYGITGDLSKRKLLPALYDIARNGGLPKTFRLLGVTRSGTSAERVAEDMRSAIKQRGDSVDESIIGLFLSGTEILKIDITDQAEYIKLRTKIEAIEADVGQCLNRLFYLSIPSTQFGMVANHLSAEGLNNGCKHGTSTSRLLIEKPFGSDMASAIELIETLHEAFDETQIFRIDHYLAKEAVQNIMTLRFRNPLFSAIWNNNAISKIMITASESIGIEGREAFYEETGALRDLIQSHLLQVLGLLTMDRPYSLDDAESIHTVKEMVMKQTRLDGDPESSAVRGQYRSYRDEITNSSSHVETYAALRLVIDSDNWRGVPILLRTGKSLKEKVTEIEIVLQDSEVLDAKNVLTIRVQPDESVNVSMMVKKPGYDNHESTVAMSFGYDDMLPERQPDAYERVLFDAMRGDRSLFASSEEVLASWRIVQPLLDVWSDSDAGLHIYDNGSWGPVEANKLAESAGTNWSENR